MTHALITAWRHANLTRRPCLLDGDRSALAIEEHHQHVSLETWLAADGLDHRGDTRLHLGLLPMPYLGPIETARVVFLLLNPGFEVSNLREEKFASVRDRFARTIRQDFADEAYPFVFLDPALAWTGGFRWWSRRLRPLMDALTAPEHWNCTLAQARRTLAQHVAALQLVPYHSEAFGLKDDVLQGMESVRLSTDFARNVLAKRAESGTTTVLVMRKIKAWELPAHARILHFPGAARGAHVPGAAIDPLVAALRGVPVVG
jgi:hypothetical protein